MLRLPAILLLVSNFVLGIETSSGPVTGKRDAGIHVFLGIPYAAPPIGELRWKAPQPPAHFQSPLNATRFGNICMQDESILRDPSSHMSEDCLTLNIWTPSANAGAKLPVMVWIHGGGFRRGSSSQPQYDGTRLAKRGVVVVSFNYRLGIFGFLVHPPNVSGNYGLLDQIEVLKWVQRNISSFGGDPSRVTLFGESAGAFSVLMLLTSPQTEGLFQRAISESGGLAVTDHPIRLPLGAAQLRALSAEELLKRAGEQVPRHPTVLENMPFRPVVDGFVLPEAPLEAFRLGHARNLALIAGTNSDEGSVFQAEDAAELRDQLFLQPTLQAVRAMSSKNRNTYVYEFSRVNGVGRKNHWGAFHSAEIAYVFGNLDVVPLGFGPVKPGTYDSIDIRLSEMMQNAWVRFAATGDPNGPGLPIWPHFDRNRRSVLRFGSVTEKIRYSAR